MFLTSSTLGHELFNNVALSEFFASEAIKLYQLHK